MNPSFLLVGNQDFKRFEALTFFQSREVTMPVVTENSNPSVSVLIFTLNEEVNLPGCLDCLDWCDDLHVVDSYSSDDTQNICETRGVSFVQHGFGGFGSQRNWALESLTLKNEWVLVLDADERVPRELASELNRLARSSPGKFGAYRMRRRFYMWGSWLRYSSLYPSWVVRFIHRDRVRYVDRGHGETQQVDGEIGELDGYLIDENLKGMTAWFERQVRYARKEAEFELGRDDDSSGIMQLLDLDPLRRRAAIKRLAASLPFRGVLYFIYSYIIRLGFLDGRNGFTFCRMKALYQNMIAVNKYDLKKARGRSTR